MGGDCVADGKVTSGSVTPQRCFANAVDNSPVVGRITAGQDITLSRAGPNGTTISFPGRVGDNVYASETLTTGSNGSAKVTATDKSVLTMGPSSSIALSGLAETKLSSNASANPLSVISGRIPASSGQPQEIRTPAAILGVRG
ncbi:MAG TPA: FecR domain-containing protein [Patescibacteria group bacterium]|nr:FecR domain-containing protein [Patescibacteria group bacterium]